MDVSIIYVNYNTISLLLNSIDSVLKETKDVEFEIIVVDNNSNDHSEATIIDKYKGQIKYIKLSENIGFGRANNVGAKIAKGRHLFFLNPDTRLLNNVVKYLSNYLDVNFQTGICGGNLYDKEFQPNHSYMPVLPSILYEINLLFNNFLYRLIYGSLYDFNSTEQPKKVGYITGADMMIRASVFNEVGGFDSDFFMYYEEAELTFRIKGLGYEIMNIPKARIIHYESKSFHTSLSKQERLLVSRKIYYYKVYKTCFLRKLSDVIFFVACLMAIVVFKITRNRDKYKVWRFNLKNYKF